MSQAATDRPQGGAETLRLLEELSAGQDFPALSQVIAQVNRIVSAEESHAEQLTDAILKDVSLTNRLLRLVNSVQFGQFGGQPVSTISRAVVILGYDTVRDTALSLMLFEHLQNHAQAQELKNETIESFYCGVIGRTLARRLGYRDSEAVFICALFRNLGRLLAQLHFFDAHRQVGRLMQTEGLSEDAAARRVFGLTYDEIGLAVGRHWHLPAELLEGMSPLPDGPVRPDAARHQVIANLARDLYDALRHTPQEELGRAVGEIARRYDKSVALPGPMLVEAIYQASEAAEKEVGLLQADARQSPLLRRLLDRRPDAPPAGPPDEQGAARTPAAGDPNDVLIGGLQELTNMLLENAHPKDMLQVAAELLHRSACFDNVVICTVDPANQHLVGRIAHGRQADTLRAGFRIPLAFNADVFHAAIGKHADVLITDTGADNIRDRIPAWYARLGTARAFLLLPMSLGQRTVALIYADKRDDPLQVSPQTLGLIKSLRNQLTMALRNRPRAP